MKRKRFFSMKKKVMIMILVLILILIGFFIPVLYYQNSIMKNVGKDNISNMKTQLSNQYKELFNYSLQMDASKVARSNLSSINNLFDDVQDDLRLLRSSLLHVFAHPEEYNEVKISPPARKRAGASVQIMTIPGVKTKEFDNMKLMGNIGSSLKNMYDTSEKINSCFVAFPEGVFVIVDSKAEYKYDESGKLKPFDFTQRDWYKGAMGQGDMYISDVFTDAFTGEQELACSLPVYRDGKLIAVIGMDLFLSKINKILFDNNAQFEQYDTVCMLDKNFTMISGTAEPDYLKDNNTGKFIDLRNSDNHSISDLCNSMSSLMGDPEMTTDPIDLELFEVDGQKYCFAIKGSNKYKVYSLVVSLDKTESVVADISSNIDEDEVIVKMEDDFESNEKKIIRLIFIVIAAVLVFAVISSYIFGKKITNPIIHFTRRIGEVHGELPEFDMTDEFYTHDEIETLALTFADMSREVRENIDKNEKLIKEKALVNADMKVAAQIQEGLLPSEYPPFPDRHEFDLYASMSPAKEVGGDFYDFFLIDDDHLVLLIADVSGKGIPAAMYMAFSKALIKNKAQMGEYSPEKILTEVNAQLCKGNRSSHFVTVWMAVLEISTGKGKAVNAGHEHPAVKRKDGSFELIKYRHSPALAVIDGIVFKEHEFKLDPGDRLFVYTDGVPEATNSNNELFGCDRMIHELNRSGDTGNEQLLKNVRAAVDRFVGDAPQFDDLTMLGFTYNGNGEQENADA